MKIKLALAVLLFFTVFLGVLIFRNNSKAVPEKESKEIKYVAIGDSYTIGLGIDEEGRWPNVLVKYLQEKGIKIELVANPSVSGFTVRDAIEIELPVVQSIKPDFVTVLIGANDNFMQRDEDDYRTDLVELLDKLQSIMTNPGNIVLVTIPDYSKSPSVQGRGEEGLSEFIQSYNIVIKEEAEKKNLPVADIFPVSQTMTGSEDYTEDGLHPSAQGYRKWEEVIFPRVFLFLRDSSDSSRRQNH